MTLFLLILGKFVSTDAYEMYIHLLQERISNIRYNVVNGKCTPMSDQSAPVYITIGDGGNQEGLVTE